MKIRFYFLKPQIGKYHLDDWTDQRSGYQISLESGIKYLKEEMERPYWLEFRLLGFGLGIAWAKQDWI